MPYLIGADSSSGSAFGRAFDPRIEGRLRAMIIMGDPLSPESRAAIPRVLRVTERQGGGIPAVIGWDIGPFLVSPRLRDILEELEPGRHDFVPIEVRSETRGPDEVFYGMYYLMVELIGLDAVVIEQTSFIKGVGQEGYEQTARFDPEASGTCALDARVIEGHHFWKLPRDFGKTAKHPDRLVTGYFCSDELWARIEEERLDGWEVQKTCALVQV
ncbi:hypothetical protein BTN82_16020 [Pseudomonas chlororaphis]|uniref:Immunity MXAN-0049 protein domain-containing protein n=2 Tax=Pseudomonas chlororaphis TaxID=587753 RepID=A0A1Q8EP44_9PSED|nr:hypothetical protein BTN82_16020 [Pseudomonas chlororaphis]